jgi:hypothetical protein
VRICSSSWQLLATQGSDLLYQGGDYDLLVEDVIVCSIVSVKVRMDGFLVNFVAQCTIESPLYVDVEERQVSPQ